MLVRHLPLRHGEPGHHTVRVMEAGGTRLRFVAIATYGSLGANGEEFRLVRRGDGWVAGPTELRVVS